MSKKLKILIYSPSYLPNIGGLENMVAMLAKNLHLLGEDIKIVTYTEGDIEDLPYPVYRHPSALQFLKLVKWCDVFFQFNISLKGIWPLLFFRRLYVVSHQTQNYYTDGSITLAGRIKQFMSRFSLNICCSSYIASLLPASTKVIPNCYNTKDFSNLHLNRNFDLIFVGRLVSDKGCNLIIEALAKLNEQNIYPTLTVVGLGPEEERLEKLVRIYNLEAKIKFTGPKTGKDLVETINQHKVMIVPSIWEEPFGIVALEGLACGCKMIVANAGGLPEAVGEHGIVFEKNNVNDLAEKIITTLNEKTGIKTNNPTQFLEQHSPSNIAQFYLLTIKENFIIH